MRKLPRASLFMGMMLVACARWNGSVARAEFIDCCGGWMENHEIKYGVLSDSTSRHLPST